MKSKPVNFRFPEELDKALEEAKWELRKSKSEIVKDAVKEYLKNKAPAIYKKYLEEKGKL
ncbi:ribbon-helix-helix protein, CopG family [Persephonella sp.]